MTEKEWQPYELHTHTPHSDGTHTLKDMAVKAKELGLSGIALTDHNTMSGLIEKESVEQKTGIHIIRGLEWTTFYGHMLTLGIERYADWRDLSPIDIQKGIDRVHDQGGIVGIAHPFAMGSPICTGCFWEYEISDWNSIDYIEVWSQTFPSIKNRNARAFELWTDTLNQGHHITAVSGIDWHNQAQIKGEPIATTFLQMGKTSSTNRESRAIQSLKKGAVSVSMGPLLLCSVQTKESDQVFTLGEEVSFAKEDRSIELMIDLDFSVRPGQWQLEDQSFQVFITSNKGILTEISVENNGDIAKCHLNVDGVHWLKAELHGVFHDIKTMIAFTNPIYFK